MNNHNIILEIINDSSLSKIDKLYQLQNVITTLSKNDLIELNVSSSISINNECFKLIINLLKVELLMINYPKEPLIKTIMEQDLLMNTTGVKLTTTTTHENNFNNINDDQLINIFIKTKLNDLQSDYQYLFKELKYDNFIDLINKKMLILNNLNNSNNNNNNNFRDLKDKLNLKILQLYLLSNYDFRNDNILNHLINEIHVQQQQQQQQQHSTNTIINNPSIEILKQVQSQPFVSFELFNIIINHNFNNGYYNIINQLMKFDKLYHNIIENNIIKLTNYFINLKIKTIYQLFELSSKSIIDNYPIIDIESIIFDMIIKNKFKNITTIDQLNQTINFNNDLQNKINNNQHDNNNDDDGIKYIGGLVNEAYMKI
ncbi:conserved hypothetical protein [Candida dubliniensis CD36]|uniref:PCI domain-containing protein n=1 Tax=Candida dubliniensis (strain CD36 / ATCC MYA-646 / CBS 7987 / NCPF 3949 / NRRL Y-17841) TaxID=573826 RepID=B9W6N3_CANDC|nr:conserved hypothetical protein [Candida dubliniensis CD36]CAX44338.1 conserved hypothetical protein [Candida dubliniensis CD36]